MRTVTKTQTISLEDFHKKVKAITYLWIRSASCPTGQDYNHDTDTDSEDDYCDLYALIKEKGLSKLHGIIVGGQWKWDGKGMVRDGHGQTIYDVQAH